MCSRGTSSACSLSVCEKIAPSARGLTGSKLQRIEESVSVKVARGGARSDDVSLPVSGEDLGSSVASGSKVTALSKRSGAVALREHEMAMVQIFRRSQDLANAAADEHSVGKTPCPVVVAQTSAKTLRNSVDDASTLKPSCRRGSRVCKKPSKVEVGKREHRNVGPGSSSHNICLEDVRGELPIGSVARKISERSSDVRLECRTRAVRICQAALRHPWIHSPHCSVNGDLLWCCSKCGKKLQSLDGCFPIYRGRNPCATSNPPPVLEERAIIVRDLGLLLLGNSGSAKFRAAPALLAWTKEIEVCRRRTKAFDWSCPDCGWFVPGRVPTSVAACEASCLGAWQGVANGEDTCP